MNKSVFFAEKSGDCKFREPWVAAAARWFAMNDEQLRGLMFDAQPLRAYHVCSDGSCPACGVGMPTFAWQWDAWGAPGKALCPHCGEKFPNEKFPDDGNGYFDGKKRYYFTAGWLLWGQWHRVVLAGVRHLAAAYVVSGEREYARKAGILLERIAEVYPTFDFSTQGLIYEKRGSHGYVDVWHHAAPATRELALSYDAVREVLPAAVCEKIEVGILRDALANRHKIRTNFPQDWFALLTLKAVLGEPYRDELDEVLERAAAVDGTTGEKGIANYTSYNCAATGEMLALFARIEPNLYRDALRKHPKLAQTFRFHLDTWCLGRYYPLVGDTHCFGLPVERYIGVELPKRAEELEGWQIFPERLLRPDMCEFLKDWSEATGDPAYAQIARGEPVQVGSVNKSEFKLAILRSDEAALWLNYEGGGAHGHCDQMNLGLFAHGLDLLPDFGYPAVHKGGWMNPTFMWYPMSAAHNTVVVDRQNQPHLDGRLTQWVTQPGFQVMRAETVPQPAPITGEHFGFYLTTPGSISNVRCNGVEISSDWRVIDGEWRIENGRLTGHGQILCTRKFPGNQRVEYDATTNVAKPCDLSAFLKAGERGLNTGVFFGFGAKHNESSYIIYNWQASRYREACQSSVVIQPGQLHRVVCEIDGAMLRHWVDGALIQSCANDGFGHVPGATTGKVFARTVGLAEAGYIVDLFHVKGGREHCKFFHSYYGTVATDLKLQPAAEFGHGTLLRNFRHDLQPKPGWTVDWAIEDRHKVLPAGKQVRLRYTDLTEGAEAHLMEGWVAVDSYNSDAEAWIPFVMTRRVAEESWFVAVIEPYEGAPNVTGIKRKGSSLEIRLRNGRRDVVRWNDEGEMSRD
ncbi:MAG: hypothetical protein PCFJNLEI_02117 [Verrucomicrobiae bacterium]|nr:hypothetical protein [Verrucomicrobiae bacterium]